MFENLITSISFEYNQNQFKLMKFIVLSLYWGGFAMRPPTAMDGWRLIGNIGIISDTACGVVTHLLG